MPKKIIIGLDGVPFRLINDLTENGVMPNIRRIIQQGTFKQMSSSIPEVSSVAWSSIITGANPGQHGIYGFTDVAPGSYRMSFTNFNNLQVPPFWKDEFSGRSVIINVPSTYPADSDNMDCRLQNGVLIAGFVALELDKAVYPQSLVKKLKDLDYQIDVDSKKAHQSMELFLRDLDKTLESRITAYQYLWDKIDWDTFMLVFTGTDRLSHFLWDAYEDETHKFHSDFLKHFRKIDEVLGEIDNKLNDNDLLIILSDHGFERLEKSVNVNVYLREHGFLKLRKQPARSLNDVDEGTIAFALDPGRIYINMEGKYPRGSVKTNEKESIINHLIQAFECLELNDRKVIDRIYRKEEIYQGDLVNRAPDLVLMPNAGFDLKARIRSEELIEKSIFTGKHNQHDAFLLVNGRFVARKINRRFINEWRPQFYPEKPSVFDIVNIFKK